jgi:hypothetical protein
MISLRRFATRHPTDEWAFCIMSRFVTQLRMILLRGKGSEHLVYWTERVLEAQLPLHSQ